MLDHFSSNGYQPGLWLPFWLTLDSLSRGGPFNAPPKVEICGGRAVNHSLRGGRYSCKLSFFYTIYGSRKRILRDILPSFGNGKQHLCRVSPSVTVLIWRRFDGSSCDVRAWIRARKGFGSERRQHGELGGVQREPRKVRARI